MSHPTASRPVAERHSNSVITISIIITPSISVLGFALHQQRRCLTSKCWCGLTPGTQSNIRTDIMLTVNDGPGVPNRIEPTAFLPLSATQDGASSSRNAARFVTYWTPGYRPFRWENIREKAVHLPRHRVSVTILTDARGGPMNMSRFFLWAGPERFAEPPTGQARVGVRCDPNKKNGAVSLSATYALHSSDRPLGDSSLHDSLHRAQIFKGPVVCFAFLTAVPKIGATVIEKDHQCCGWDRARVLQVER
uniref:Uncharacterized protein n=1 Tax=Anopheles culicifacies TaxID=139723 RepID=A0A182MSG6_9DIPT